MTQGRAEAKSLAIALAVIVVVLATAGCRGPTSGADDAISAFMERISLGDEVGARAFWALDYPLGSSDETTLYSQLVRDLSRAGQRVSYEQHSVFYYRDAAFSQPVRRAQEAQVSQVDLTLRVGAPGDSPAEGRFVLVLARSPGTPEEWQIFAVRTQPEVVKQFADAVALVIAEKG